MQSSHPQGLCSLAEGVEDRGQLAWWDSSPIGTESLGAWGVVPQPRWGQGGGLKDQQELARQMQLRSRHRGRQEQRCRHFLSLVHAGCEPMMGPERRQNWRAVRAEDGEARSRLSCFSPEAWRVQPSELRWTLASALWEVCIFQNFLRGKSPRRGEGLSLLWQEKWIKSKPKIAPEGWPDGN